MMLSMLLAAALIGVKEPLSDGWEFSRDEIRWENVTVPHDWAISGPFNPSNDVQRMMVVEDGETNVNLRIGRTGALPVCGTGVYRRKVALPKNTERAALVFEGAMSEPEVFVNGTKVGEWRLGYTTFSVQVPRSVVRRASGGSFDLEVRLRNRPSSSRWYSGAGLFRPVYLVLNSEDPEETVLGRPDRRVMLPKIELSEKGFFVGGRRVIFNGVCLHHDLGAVGAAWNAAAFRRQVRILKEFGCNAIRTAHNIPCPEQLDICDEEGMFVMAESFDAWHHPKVANDYHLWYDDWWKKDLTQLVKVCRDHPCVVMYSIGNEIHEHVHPEGLAMAKAMQDYLHALDPTRPVTQGMNRAIVAARHGTVQAMDLCGANYCLFDWEALHKVARHGLVLGAETASAISSRGVYHLPVREGRVGDSPYPDGQITSYDTELSRWCNYADEDLAMAQDHPWVAGQFVWTGFDYLGEPTPYNNHWPSRSSYFGFVDLAGLPKDRAYLYRSVWRTDDHTLHVLPHWTWDAASVTNVPVYVYTDAPEAELFVNGEIMGVVRKNAAALLDRFRLRWNHVPYRPGNIRVVARYADGSRLEKTVRTAGAPASLRLTADRSCIGLRAADGTDDLSYVTVEVVDRVGVPCPDAEVPLTFGIEGDAIAFRGVCNGDPTSLEVFTEPRMRTFHGKLVVTLASRRPGRARLSVRSATLPSAGLEIDVR